MSDEPLLTRWTFEVSHDVHLRRLSSSLFFVSLFFIVPDLVLADPRVSFRSLVFYTRNPFWQHACGGMVANSVPSSIFFRISSFSTTWSSGGRGWLRGRRSGRILYWPMVGATLTGVLRRMGARRPLPIGLYMNSSTGKLVDLILAFFFCFVSSSDSWHWLSVAALMCAFFVLLMNYRIGNLSNDLESSRTRFTKLRKKSNLMTSGLYCRPFFLENVFMWNRMVFSFFFFNSLWRCNHGTSEIGTVHYNWAWQFDSLLLISYNYYHS